ncbi:MAG: hypothetical protein JWO67_4863 [Streptosporangiaceae bacterium]|nr:hypothetical protein [Streptosporangiaceae bacterium]
MSNPVYDDDFPVLTSGAQLQDVQVRAELVVVKPWRRKVWCQELTGEELDEFREPMSVIGKDNSITLNLKNNTLRLLAMAIRDANGNRLYPNTDAGIKILGKMPSSGLEILAAVARRLSGMGEDDVEEMAGKSEAEQTSASSDDSPSQSAA